MELDVLFFLSTTPNPRVGNIDHERMTILPSIEEDFSVWLSGRPDDAFTLACKYPLNACE